MSREFLSFVQFGDLHIQNADDENYITFQDLIKDANQHLAGEFDFAFLPGDNADDGSDGQYALVKDALEKLQMPVHIITGDHDSKPGTLDLFRKYLELNLYRAVELRSFRLLFLNAMDGPDSKTFDLSGEQFAWVERQMADAKSCGCRIVVFNHLYPSELQTFGSAFSELIGEYGVELVAMGHTHYNELANDGHTVYATTRSTGQSEEGPPGFSLTTIDGDVVAWKFKEAGPWPFVMITSPADARLITRPDSDQHVVRRTVPIRAKVWGGADMNSACVTCSLDGEAGQLMELRNGHWEMDWNTETVPNGLHNISVRVMHKDFVASDDISVFVNQAGEYNPPQRSSVDYENQIGTDATKCILGTQLGPNKNGTKGPWPSWRRSE